MVDHVLVAGPVRQYLHFPQGNGSYSLATSLSKNPAFASPWAVGDGSSGAYMTGTFPVFHSHPRSNGPRFADISARDFAEYESTVKHALRTNYREGFAIAHHGFVLADALSRMPGTIVASYLHGTGMLALQEGVPTHVADKLRQGVDKSQLVFVMSQQQRDMAETVYKNELHDRPLVIGGGVDTSIFHRRDVSKEDLRPYGIDPDKQMILFAGRFTPEKGLDTLLAACDNRSFMKNRQLVLVGGGSLNGALENYARKANMPAVFVPPQDQDVLAGFMSAADVFVLPSRYESFGLVCLEALACETPVVASDVGILPTLVNPPRGGAIFTHSYRPSEGLRAALDTVLREGTRVPVYGRAVREEHSWDRIIGKIQGALARFRPEPEMVPATR